MAEMVKGVVIAAGLTSGIASGISLIDSLIGFFSGSSRRTEAETQMLNELKMLKSSLESKLDGSRQASDRGFNDLRDLNAMTCRILALQQEKNASDRSVDLENTKVMTNKLTDINSSVGEILSGQEELKKHQEVIVKLQEEMAKLQKAASENVAGPSGYRPGVYGPPHPGYMGYPPPYFAPPQFNHPMANQPYPHQFPPPPPHFGFDRPFYEDNLLRHQQRSFSGSSCSIASSIQSLIPTNFSKYDQEEEQTETTPKPPKEVSKCQECSKSDNSLCENCIKESKSAGHMYFDATGYLKKKGRKKQVSEEIRDENVKLDVEQSKGERKGKTYLPRRNAGSVADSCEVRSNVGEDLESCPDEEYPPFQQHSYTENWLRMSDQQMYYRDQFGGATYDGRDYSAYNNDTMGRGPYPPGNFHQRGYSREGFRGNRSQDPRWFGGNRGGRYRENNTGWRQDNYHQGGRMYLGADHREDSFRGNHRGRRMYSGADNREDSFRGNHRGRRMYSGAEHREDNFQSPDEGLGRRSQPMFNDQQQSNRLENNDPNNAVVEGAEGIVPAMESLRVTKKGKKKNKANNKKQSNDSAKQDLNNKTNDCEGAPQILSNAN